MTTEVTTAATEATTVAATTATDAEAAGTLVGSLFVENGRAILGLCRLLLRDPVEAEDAAQQTFLSAHRALAAGGRPRQPAAWLAAIARNECRARLRLRTREALPLPDLPADLPDPLARAIRNADLDALWAALATLPRRQRRAFLLRELGGLSYSELGAALGVSRPAVESLLFRARQQLRGALAGGQAVLAPAAVRDRLADLIPSFDPGSASVVGRVAALPVAAKLATATATVGVGLLASGSAGLHDQVPPTRARPAAAPAHEVARPAVRRMRRAVRPIPVAAVVRRTASAVRRRSGADHGERREPAGPIPHPDGDQSSGRIENEPPAATVPATPAPAPTPVETTREEEAAEPATETDESGEDNGGGDAGRDGESSHSGEGSGSGKG